MIYFLFSNPFNYSPDKLKYNTTKLIYILLHFSGFNYFPIFSVFIFSSLNIVSTAMKQCFTFAISRFIKYAFFKINFNPHFYRDLCKLNFEIVILGVILYLLICISVWHLFLLTKFYRFYIIFFVSIITNAFAVFLLFLCNGNSMLQIHTTLLQKNFIKCKL